MQFRKYKPCINYLFSLERAGIKYDLKNIRTILRALGNPEKEIKTVHIAGTNGKGSVASILNSILLSQGYKTALYTSPHIRDFRERILVNSKPVTKKFVIDFTNSIIDIIKKIGPSFFEVTTAMAFKYFAYNKVDYAIIEAGLGGRLDSTNVIKPCISVITGISIDHTEYLGNNIKNIAFEKAGIIKRSVPCVAGNLSPIAYNIISRKCVKEKSKLFKGTDFRISKTLKKENGIIANFRFGSSNLKDVFIPMIGDFQLNNIKTALTALKILSEVERFKIDDVSIIAGFKNIIKNSCFYGRFQLINKSPKIIIDVSHNRQGIANIKRNLNYIKYKKLILIFGMMNDKQYDKCVKLLEKLEADNIILTKADYKRAAEPSELYKHFRKNNNLVITPSVRDAFLCAKKIAKQKDLILITGSFFLISDFISFYPLTSVR
ncbi:bifunctional folylpolyglutamate synthase/dihydrofolate synthase [bacterium]|nr:MAG: bifunctional folylpolyglutamate synthase/dihydrofolate synthase [bacterium]